LNDDLLRRAAGLGRIRKTFAFFSWLSAIGLGVCSALSIAMLLGDQSLLAPIVPELSDPLPPPGNLPIAHLIALGSSLCFLSIVAVICLLWLYSSIQLVKLAGAESPRHGALSAVAMHFVPVLAGIMPMLIVAELEKQTRSPQGWKLLDTSALPPTGWVLSRFSAVGLLGSYGYLNSAETASSYVTGLAVMTAAGIAAMVSLFLINRLLERVHGLQVVLVSRETPPASISSIDDPSIS
jgi:hypothetical protein